MKRVSVVFLVLPLCCMSCGGDDEAPRIGGPSGSAPVISDLQCPQTSFEEGQGGGVVTVEGCSVEFIDADQDLETILQSVTYNAQDCETKDPLDDIAFDVRAQAIGKRQGTILFDARVQTGCVPGTYTYAFSALDSEGNASNVLFQSFDLVEGAP